MKSDGLHSESKCRDRLGARGAGLIPVIIVMGVATVFLTGLVSSLVYSHRVILNNSTTSHYEIASQSVLDYTLNGIRQGWCFDGLWLEDTECNLFKERNIERLLMSDQAIQNIMLGPAGTFPNPIRLQRISHTIDIDALHNGVIKNHPLQIMTSELRSEVSSITISINRVDSIDQPTRGREVYLHVRVELNPKLTAVHLLGRRIYAESKVLVFPRELGTFGLVVANDLILNGKKTPGDGDTNIPPLLSQPQSGGLVFESPVFVNNDLYVPAPSDDGYAAVTFMDQVVLGSGSLKTAPDADSKPNSFGAVDDRFYGQISNFGGLHKGVQLDRSADNGLKVLAGLLPSAQLEEGGVDLCRLRMRARLDLSLTRDSRLLNRVLSYTPPATSGTINTSLDAALSVGSINNFVGLSVGTNRVGTDNGLVTVDNGDTLRGPGVMRLTVLISNLLPGTAGKTSFVSGVEVQNSAALLSFNMSSNSRAEIRMNRKAGASTAGRIVIETSPHSVNGNTQRNRVNLNVRFERQELWDVAELTEYVPGGLELVHLPRVEIKVDAFDYGYLGTEVSRREVFDPTKPLDTQSGHPQMGLTKTNGFIFTAQAGTKAFVLERATRADGTLPPGANGWFTCSAMDDASVPGFVCPAMIDPDDEDEEYHWPFEDSFDYVAFDRACGERPILPTARLAPAFSMAPWSTSFTSSAKRSWNFTEQIPSGGGFGEPMYLIGNPYPVTFGRPTGAPDPYDTDELAVFDPANALVPDFHVRSLLSKCVISAQANFVAGFLTCEELVIEERQNPLRIVGTIIAGKASIHRSAVQAGIRWSSIYHPSAAPDLRRVRILRDRVNMRNCDEGAIDSADRRARPIWLPFPAVEDLQFNLSCNTISLRDKADPFRWTQVDPDCGFVASGSTQSVQCKYRLRRFGLFEFFRGGS